MKTNTILSIILTIYVILNILLVIKLTSTQYEYKSKYKELLEENINLQKDLNELWSDYKYLYLNYKECISQDDTVIILPKDQTYKYYRILIVGDTVK